MARPPFDMLRAAFWILAVIIGVMMLGTIAAGAVCGYMVTSGRAPLGTCNELGVADRVREIWDVALTTIMALIAISRSGGPPPPKPPDDGDM
jgi:hypothetical protein